MGYEFSESEHVPCNFCGSMLPYGMLTELEDGRLICDECLAELDNEEEDY